MRFAIRDLFWLALVVAIAMAWRNDNRRLNADIELMGRTYDLTEEKRIHAKYRDLYAKVQRRLTADYEKIVANRDATIRALKAEKGKDSK